MLSRLLNGRQSQVEKGRRGAKVEEYRKGIISAKLFTDYMEEIAAIRGRGGKVVRNGIGRFVAEKSLFDAKTSQVLFESKIGGQSAEMIFRPSETSDATYFFRIEANEQEGGGIWGEIQTRTGSCQRLLLTDMDLKHGLSTVANAAAVEVKGGSEEGKRMATQHEHKHLKTHLSNQQTFERLKSSLRNHWPTDEVSCVDFQLQHQQQQQQQQQEGKLEKIVFLEMFEQLDQKLGRFTFFWFFI